MSLHNPASVGYGNDSFNTNILNNNNNSFNTNNSNNSIWNITLTEDRSEILTWLSPLEPHLRHDDIKIRRVDNVGEWLLQTEQFQRWRSSGRPGGPQK